MSDTPASAIGTRNPHELRSTHWLLLGLCLALFVALRIVWIGHLLTWDEAMTLCTVRSFVSGGEDYFSNWLWRHPPLFPLLMSLLSPLKTGFAERVEVLAIALGAVNLLILFHLNRRLFGIPVALASVFFLAVMPGAVFFDVWVKTDHPVNTFGLLAIILLLANRTFYAGLSLGLAFLFKETAVFYAGVIGLLWMCGVTGRRRFSDLFAITCVPLVTCGWWYLMVTLQPNQDISAGGPPPGILDHIWLAFGGNPLWVKPWNYYVGQLFANLGWLGGLLSLGGLAALIWRARIFFMAGPVPGEPFLFRGWLWPVLLAVPSIVLLSLLPGKVPWIVIVLLPALATLQAVAAAALVAEIHRRLTSHPAVTPVMSRSIAAGAALVMGLLCLTAVFGRDYESVLRKIDAGQAYGASCSREAARIMNRLVKDDERVLLTSFHYWQGIQPGDPCAVFAYYYERRGGVILRSHKASFEDLLKDIRKYELDWALLSPEMGKAEFEIFDGFIKTLHLNPCRLRRAYIFHTTELYQAQP